MEFASKDVQRPIFLKNIVLKVVFLVEKFQAKVMQKLIRSSFSVLLMCLGLLGIWSLIHNKDGEFHFLKTHEGIDFPENAPTTPLISNRTNEGKRVNRIQHGFLNVLRHETLFCAS